VTGPLSGSTQGRRGISPELAIRFLGQTALSRWPGSLVQEASDAAKVLSGWLPHC